ncbi:hypothetical protein AcV5_009183 [Taiwanofungus camphoratus]|nr:hypothetical protein AcV5_009183 [Antrodia cinnamomea]KAI0954160.1 hypothetical protein AcV7_007474 [Antrodia cinnamomea]
MMAILTDLPIELFLDNILPLLSVPDLYRLSCTSRFFYQLASDDPFWHRKIQADYNFSGSETARDTGWKFLYKRLSNPKVFVWGEKSHGRLGLSENDTPRTVLRDGVPYPVQLRIPGVHIVNLAAGGMSFHALDSHGDIYVWGVLDGLDAALRSEGFSIASKRAEQPMRLKLPVKFRSISCGRLHFTALDAAAQVWTFTSWGRPFRLSSSLLDKSSPETTPIQIESGWAFSSVLTESGDVLVYWPFMGRMKDRIAERNEELDEQSASVPTKALPTAAEPLVIPCHSWVLEGIDPIRLPPIPISSLPKLAGTGLTKEQLNEETKLIKIAGADNTIIGLTNQGHVLKYGMLAGEDTYRQAQWEFLPEFSDVRNVKNHPTFSDTTEAQGDRPEPPELMHITHISAQFQTFVAYSTGPRSVVLMGKLAMDTPNLPERPIILPALQNQNVISVVLGDYHFGALTSTGKLLTWGAFSKGALGLGDPAQIEPGQPGGFADPVQKQAAVTSRWGILRFFPPDVRVPTEVRFDHGERKKRERYCFAAAAAGWHMGALMIDLEPDEDEHDDEIGEMPGAFPADSDIPPIDSHPVENGPGNYPTLPITHGGGIFRFGHAARGVHRRRGRGN